MLLFLLMLLSIRVEVFITNTLRLNFYYLLSKQTVPSMYLNNQSQTITLAKFCRSYNISIISIHIRLISFRQLVFVSLLCLNTCIMVWCTRQTFPYFFVQFILRLIQETSGLNIWVSYIINFICFLLFYFTKK